MCGSNPLPKSIEGVSRGSYQERGSKFLGFLLPLRDEEEFGSRLDALSREHHSARHVVWAYRLPDHEYCSDAGEPHRSAGPPLLTLLISHDLLFAGLIVVRYFGGVKLGKGNLARAYRAAGEEAIKGATLHTLERRILYRCRPPMERVGDLYAAIHRFSLSVQEETFTPSPLFRVTVAKATAEAFEDYLRSLSIPYERDEEAVWERTSV